MLYAFFWVIPRRLNFICRRFGTLRLFHLHRQVGAIRLRPSPRQNFSRIIPQTWHQTSSFYTHLPAYERSETSVYKIQTPGNNPKEIIWHSEHGESLKSRIYETCVTLKCDKVESFITWWKFLMIMVTMKMKFLTLLTIDGFRVCVGWKAPVVSLLQFTWLYSCSRPVEAPVNTEQTRSTTVSAMVSTPNARPSGVEFQYTGLSGLVVIDWTHTPR